MIAFALVAGLLATSELGEPTRSNEEMCTQVAYELNISVQEGSLSRKHADRIINRCYRLYVDHPQP